MHVRQSTILRHTILLALLPITGCQYARSFLHMNSNSSSPFLGLELSVDASEQGLRPDEVRGTAGANPAAAHAEFIGENPRPASAEISGSEQFVATSESWPQSGTLKYSLPAMNQQNGSVEAEEVDAILDRFRG